MSATIKKSCLVLFNLVPEKEERIYTSRSPDTSRADGGLGTRRIRLWLRSV